MIVTNVLCSWPEGFYRLFSLASTSRRNVQHLYSWREKCKIKVLSGFSKELISKQIAVHEIFCNTGSHRVLSLCVCQSTLTVAPSVCCPAALDAWALLPAGYCAAADECTEERSNFKEDFKKRCSEKKVFINAFNLPWPFHISACPEAWLCAHPSLLVAPTR